MARRNANTQTTDESTEAVAPESTEEVVAETTTEAATPTEAPVEEEKEVDLTEFQNAATEAVASADETTGDLPKESLDAVNKVYREIDGIKGKNSARSWLESQMKDAIKAKDITKARAFVDLKDGLSAGSGGGSSTRTPADPTAAFVQKVVALRLALNEVVANVPEGVGEDWEGKADEASAAVADELDTYRAYLNSTDEDAEAPEVSPVVRQVFKLAQGKGSTGGGSSRVAGGPRRDIVKHMEQVFADLDTGAFLTVNEIAKAASTEYGADRPSAGAVSARLFPKGKPAFENETIKATHEDGKSRGATKVA